MKARCMKIDTSERIKKSVRSGVEKERKKERKRKMNEDPLSRNQKSY